MRGPHREEAAQSFFAWVLGAFLRYGRLCNLACKFCQNWDISESREMGTLAMTFYTELDVSSIDELPPGRKPVNTVVVPEERRNEVIQRICHACTSGRQHDLVFIDGLHAALHQADVSVGQSAVQDPRHGYGLGRKRLGLIDQWTHQAGAAIFVGLELSYL